MHSRRSKTIARTTLGVAFLALSGALGIVCARSPVPNSPNQHSDSLVGSVAAALAPSPAFAQTPSRPGTVSIADVAGKVVPSVVNIYANRVIKTGPAGGMSPLMQDPLFQQFFGGRMQVPREQTQRSLGSGVIVSKDGIILTNNHVVEQADEIHVSFADRTDLKAKIVGTDPKTDLAVIRVEGHVKGLHPLQFGDSSALRLGDVVLAVGNPFGVGQTVTMGIVSATGRANMGLADYEDFIQTDAAINPGNSGGALVNMNGQLVGINTAILSHSGGNQGIGFAIPSNMAKTIMDSLLTHGKVVRGWLGVTIQDMNPQLAEAMGTQASKGVLISDVTDKSPAAKAGLKRGDVIVSVNGEAMKSSAQLRSHIATLGKDAKVSLEVVRNGEHKDFEITLGELPENAGGKVVEQKGLLDGLHLEELNSENRAKFDIGNRISKGVVVTEVASGTAAEQTGLQPGDVIIEVNRQPVTSLEAFQKTYKSSKQNLLLLVYRQGSTVYLMLRK